MSALSWSQTFKNISPRTQMEALSQQLVGPTLPTNAATGGISREQLDATFGEGFYARLMDRGPMVQYSPRPNLYTQKPFMPQDPRRPFNVPQPLTNFPNTPAGNAAMDRANMEANRAMLAPGGAMGFWGRKVAPIQPAPTTDVFGGNGSRAIVSPYGTAAVNFSGRHFRGSQNADAKLRIRGGMDT